MGVSIIGRDEVAVQASWRFNLATFTPVCSGSPMGFNVFRIAKGLERREEVVYEPDFDGFLILLEIYDGGIFSGRLYSDLWNFVILFHSSM